MKLIIPAAGKSSRYPRQKWLLTHPSGSPMVTEAIRLLPIETFEEVYLCTTAAILETTSKSMIYDDLCQVLQGRPLQIVCVPETRNQPETVYQAIQQRMITGPIFIKDTDNQFRCHLTGGNEIVVQSLNECRKINPSNKSYVETNANGFVINCVEKQVRSGLFSAGGYGFQSARQFCQFFERNREHDNLYISNLIFDMLLCGVPFRTIPAFTYQDWGTIHEWNEYKRGFATIFIDIDGVLFKSTPGSWSTATHLEQNCAYLRSLFNSGRVTVILTSARPEAMRAETVQQLNMARIRHHQLLLGLPHSQRIIVNDFAGTNPFPSCHAVNLVRNSDELEAQLAGFFPENK